ncbi:MAG: cellulose biosynthesis cyclic di-GMP-binding regulatory protein BcsB [Roseinatronobacter sp.]|nr:cellulose biosynthesis cyclic di-GMP-binding regulatory protein BcsB [Roseinatronobacter sp.]
MTSRARLHRQARTLRGFALAACLSASFGPAFSQGSDAGLIILPEDDGMVLPDVTLAAGLDARIDPARRVAEHDTAPRGPDTGARGAISPLRLVDMSYRVQGGIARIAGERAVLNFDLYAQPNSRDAQLQLVTLSGINNLPERSALRVWVNGQEIGTRNLTHIAAFGADRMSIPPGLLLAGRNHVQIEFRQHHRIFCGPEAAFDLWTDIDLAQSGVLITPADAPGQPDADDFLMALAAPAAGPGAIEIRGLEALGAESEIWRGFLVARLNQVLGGAPLGFAFQDYWTTAPQAQSQARITLLPAAQSRARFARGGDGALVMVLEIAQGTRPEDMFTALAALQPQPQDQRAALVVPQQPVAFSDFGAETERFAQRYAQRDHAFRLPEDWLVLTAAKARIYLDYAYAPGLPQGSVLLVKVNGTSVRMLPLRGEGGRPISRFPIDFEARLLQSGLNVLSFEMFVPGDPPSLPCAAQDMPFLQIAGSSVIDVPYSPPMVIADMGHAFAALAPGSLRRNDMSSRAFAPIDEAMLAAALARSQPAPRAAALHLIALEDMGSIPTSHYRASRMLLENALLAAETAPALTAEAVTDSTDPFRASEAEARGISVALGAGWARLSDHMLRLMGRVFPASGDDLNLWLAQQRGQAVLFQLDPERPDDIWMLRGPDSDMGAIAHAMARARILGAGPRGQVSVLGHDGTWSNWYAPDRTPRLLAPWTRPNFRTALGNIVSARPIFYTILMLGIAVLSALIALRLVISTREHST